MSADFTAPPSHRFYSIENVARSFDVSVRTVRRWIKSGALRARRIGRVVRISHDDLDEFIARHEHRNEGRRGAVLPASVNELPSVGKTAIK